MNKCQHIFKIKEENISTICRANTHHHEIPVVEFFIQNNKEYPNILQLRKRYDADKFYKWCLQQNSSPEPMIYNSRNQNLTINQRVYVFAYSPDIYIYYDNDLHSCGITFFYLNSAKQKVDELALFMEDIRVIEEKESACNIISLYDGRFELRELAIKDIHLNVAENYNDDFLPFDTLIKESLSSKNGKGILLLHGLAGTGKTNYIRHLINYLDDKKQVIYLPPALTNSLTDPNFINFLINECTDSVIVIEDAEMAIKSRKTGFSSDAISNLLNISDGILNDALKIQIIATFNTNISDVDSALKRKGRIIADYKFGKLAIDKAQKLSNKLGFNTVINETMTLADIYNQDAQDFQEINQSIGFRNNTYLEAP